MSGRSHTTPSCRIAEEAAEAARRCFVPGSTAETVERIRRELNSAESQSTRALVAAVDARDPYTRAHSLNVAAYAEMISAGLHLAPAESAAIRQAAHLHDIGKIGVPDAILTKPGPLTDDEFNTIKQHPEIAIDILGHLSYLTVQLPMILHHHERFDGRGYPEGLSGPSIPLGARILAAADALDTMFSPRTYKPAYGLERVRAELIAGAGRQFDPRIVAIILPWLDTPSVQFPRVPDALSL